MKSVNGIALWPSDIDVMVMMMIGSECDDDDNDLKNSVHVKVPISYNNIFKFV